MVGQDKIINKLKMFNFNTFPRSNLLIGDNGCGKHTFIQEICNQFNIESHNISDIITNDLLSDIYISPHEALYIIDINELSKKFRYINKENAILKFVEEPPDNCIITVLVESPKQIIDTIKNRCIVWSFDKYDINTLKLFKQFSNESLYQLLNTPGKIISCKDESYYNDLLSLCNNIICNITKATVSNSLSLEKYVFGDDVLYDVDLFFKCMYINLFDMYIKYNDDRLLKCYFLTQEYIEKNQVLNINKKYLFDSYILKLKQIYD